MSRYIIVRTSVPSSEVSAPTAEAIATGFRDAVLNVPALTTHGAWVGPRPRVTRIAPFIGAPTTRAVWLFQSDDTTTAAFDRVLADSVGAHLRQQTSGDILPLIWTEAIAEPFSPAVHGELAWWQSGRAASTRTQDEFPSLISTDPGEAPGGETPPGGGVTDSVTQVLKALAWVAVPAAVIGVAWYVGPVIQRLTGTDSVSEGARARRELTVSARAARSNPRRRSRHR